MMDVENKIFVGGLPRDIDEVGLMQYFQQFAAVEKVDLKRDQATGTPRGFAFVKFRGEAAGILGIPHIINGKQVDVKLPVPKGGQKGGQKAPGQPFAENMGVMGTPPPPAPPPGPYAHVGQSDVAANIGDPLGMAQGMPLQFDVNMQTLEPVATIPQFTAPAGDGLSPAPPMPCWYYQRGLCQKGEKCPYPHIIDGSAALDDDDPRPSCWYYERGLCKNSTNCKFKHVGIVPQDPAAIKKMKASPPQKLDNISLAAKLAMQSVRSFPPGQDPAKTQGRIETCARDVGQNMHPEAKPLETALQDYARGFYEALFTLFGDETWIYEADLLLVLDVAIGELFPQLKSSISTEDLQILLISAHLDAFDEQRCAQRIRELVHKQLQGPRIRKQFTKIITEGRQAAVRDPEVGGADNFAEAWIEETVKLAQTSYHGYFDGMMSEDVAVELFVALLESGLVPPHDLQTTGMPPDGWRPLVATACRASYAAAAPANARQP